MPQEKLNNLYDRGIGPDDNLFPVDTRLRVNEERKYLDYSTPYQSEEYSPYNSFSYPQFNCSDSPVVSGLVICHTEIDLLLPSLGHEVVYESAPNSINVNPFSE